MASEPTTRPVPVRPLRLWFGLACAFFCWFGLGLADMFITWRACMHNEQMGNASSHPASSIAAFVVTFLLIGLTAWAGYISWANWRKLSAQRDFFEAEGDGRHEFMALIGLFISFTLGIGMIWMLLPLFILRLCARVR